MIEFILTGNTAKIGREHMPPLGKTRMIINSNNIQCVAFKENLIQYSLLK